MVANLIISAAAPIGAGKTLPSFGRNVVRKASDLCKFETNSGHGEPSRKRRRGVPVEERLHMRRLKNKESAQQSREKARLQREYVEKKLNELQYEKMKLLLENEMLKRENQELEEENTELRCRTQSSGAESEYSEVEAAFKHAWLVSSPLRKEWALPRIFFILMVSTLKFLKASYWDCRFLLDYACQKTSPHSEIVFNLVPKLLKKTTFLKTSLQHLMIFNG